MPEAYWFVLYYSQTGHTRTGTL